jgi:serine/threonine-protein kinase
MLRDRWHVDRLIGVGGMSSVYAATHRNGGRVAIKVLHRQLASRPAALRRFLREGYIANRVGHAGAVSILDDDVTSDGLFFLVMELLRGHTLEQQAELHGGRLTPDQVLQVTDGLLEILQAAHENGVVHRDLKPGNVFLTADGRVKLLDFGISCLTQWVEAEGITNSQLFLGTPAFMAPEQARGRLREVDSRTDVWAVGASMYRLLTGRHVHPRETAQEQLIAAATEPAPALTGVLDVPPALAALVDRALAFEPGQRWQSAREMRNALLSLSDSSRGSSDSRELCGFWVEREVAAGEATAESNPALETLSEAFSISANVNKDAVPRSVRQRRLGAAALVAWLALGGAIRPGLGAPNPARLSTSFAPKGADSPVQSAALSPSHPAASSGVVERTVPLAPRASRRASRAPGAWKAGLASPRQAPPSARGLPRQRAIAPPSQASEPTLLQILDERR